MMPLILRNPLLPQQERGPCASREALPFSRHCRPGASLLRLVRGPLPFHPWAKGELSNPPQQALATPQWLRRSPQPKPSPVPLSVQQQQQLRQQQQLHLQQRHEPQRRNVSALLSRFANIKSCSSVEAASVRQRGSRVYVLHTGGPLDASFPKPHGASLMGLSTPLLHRPKNEVGDGSLTVHPQQHPDANALPTATSAAAAAAITAVPVASAPSAEAATATEALPGMFDEHEDGQRAQGSEPHSFQQQQQQKEQQQQLQVQQQMAGPRLSPSALHQSSLHQLPLQQHLHEQQQLLQLHQHLLQQQQLHLRQQQLRGRRPQQPAAAALQQQQQIHQQGEQHLQQQLPFYDQQGLQQAQETQQQQETMPLQLQPLQQHEQQQPYELQDQQHSVGVDSIEDVYQSQQEHALLLQQHQQQQECGQQQQLGVQEQEHLQQQEEEVEQQERLAAELYFVEQQLAEKEALLSLFEGALEKQQQLQVEEQLQHLQQQQLQLQQLLQLIEQQKQELAEQRQQVEAQHRELHEALLQQQQQEEALKQQQALQQAAVDEQQRQQQWFKEQQQAFAAAQDEFAAKQQQQQQQQQELAQMHDLLQQQEAELTEKQRQQQQQQQLLLQQTTEVQASIRLQGAQLLQQHQALQRQLQQQRELQQQILEYQRQQLRETEEALAQKQQQQQHLLLLQHDRPVSTHLPVLAGGSTLRHQERQHEHLQQHRLQQQLQQQQVQQIKLQEELQQQLLRQEKQYEEVTAAHWCSCEPECPLTTALGAPKALKSAGAPQSAADSESRRGESYESTRLPSEEHRKTSRTAGSRIPKFASRGPQTGPPPSAHVEGREEEASRQISARGRSEGPQGGTSSRAAADGEGPRAQASSFSNQAPHKTGGPRRTGSIPSSGSTCPPRLLRSTESQRLREKSLQEHLKVLQVAKRPVGSRGTPKRAAEHGRTVSADSVRSAVSPVRNKSSGGAVQGETPRRHPQHLSNGGPETRRPPRDPFSPHSARLGGPLTPTSVKGHDAFGGGPLMGGGGSPPPHAAAAFRRQPRGVAEASLTGSVMPPHLGAKQQQQQLQQLLQEQRRVINLLLLEKQQLEREASGAGGGAPPCPEGVGLSPRTQGGPWRPRAFPREPYVKESRECGAQEGDTPGCVCGGDHPRTAWGPLDAALAEAHNNNAGLQRWTKVNEGVYFYGDTQVTLSFVNGRLMAQTDAGPLVWNKGARGDVLKFIKASDERYLQRNAAA
ncbi:hypothetical protein Esti_002062 [Eimeria stiedai]